MHIHPEGCPSGRLSLGHTPLVLFLCSARTFLPSTCPQSSGLTLGYRWLLSVASRTQGMSPPYDTEWASGQPNPSPKLIGNSVLFQQLQASQINGCSAAHTCPVSGHYWGLLSCPLLHLGSLSSDATACNCGQPPDTNNRCSCVATGPCRPPFRRGDR